MSVIYQKEITQCPHCKIYPDPDPDDWFCDEEACCSIVKDEQNLPKDIEGMLRPYEKVGIPDWCPLKVTN